MLLENIEIDTAAAFIAHMQLTHAMWWTPGQPRCPWYFRGQADATWRLQPKAWRPDGQRALELLGSLWQEWVAAKAEDLFADGMRPPKIQRDRIHALLLQAASELEAVSQFVDFADELGYPIPSNPTDEWTRFIDCSTFYPGHRLITIKGVSFRDDIEPEPTAAFALAQHHGVPTRLLDWTRKPMFAAFFAAEDALAREANGAQAKHIAVWAVDRHQIDLDRRIKPITVPRHQLGYLHAQDGLFLWDSMAHAHFAEHGQWPYLDESLLHENSVTDGNLGMRRLTLPISEVPELLERLFVERVSRAHLMPTLDNITHTLRLRAQLAQKPEPRELE